MMASFADCVIRKFSGTPVCAKSTITRSKSISFHVLPTPYTLHTACPIRRCSVKCCALFNHLSLWPGCFVSCLQPLRDHCLVSQIKAQISCILCCCMPPSLQSGMVMSSLPLHMRSAPDQPNLSWTGGVHDLIPSPINPQALHSSGHPLQPQQEHSTLACISLPSHPILVTVYPVYLTGIVRGMHHKHVFPQLAA